MNAILSMTPCMLIVNLRHAYMFQIFDFKCFGLPWVWFKGQVQKAGRNIAENGVILVRDKVSFLHHIESPHHMSNTQRLSSINVFWCGCVILI